LIVYHEQGAGPTPKKWVNATTDISAFLAKSYDMTSAEAIRIWYKPFDDRHRKICIGVEAVLSRRAQADE
jgi:hypothetical protein